MAPSSARGGAQESLCAAAESDLTHSLTLRKFPIVPFEIQQAGRHFKARGPNQSKYAKKFQYCLLRISKFDNFF